MTDILAIWKALLTAGVLGYLAGTVAFGLSPTLRSRQKQKVFIAERVVLAGDVNTELSGYQVGKNDWNFVLLSLAFVFLLAVSASDVLAVIGCFGYIGGMISLYHRRRQFQKQQGFFFTEKGVWLFPENLGRPLWRQAKGHFTAWQQVTGYKIDGSFVQFYQEGGSYVQVEYLAADYERVKSALSELGVERLELTDRLWVAQVDEERFYAMEDEINDLGWDLLDLFHEELERMRLRPEFGVMRNMPGDRLFEEQARSWLQLNLLDTDSSERVAASSFLLWHSTGSVGYLLGLSGQELIDRLQEWMKRTLRDAEAAKEVVVS